MSGKREMNAWVIGRMNEWMHELWVRWNNALGVGRINELMNEWWVRWKNEWSDRWIKKMNA